MSRHIIHQQAIAINASDRSSTQPLFLEISRLFNNRAKDAAGYVLDKYDQENELLKIDVLEVDLGELSFPFSEENVVKVYSERLEEALSGAIKKQLQLADPKTRQSEMTFSKRSLLNLLEQFLLTGTIAWWAGKEELKDPVRVFITLQEKEMPALREMIMRLFPETGVRKRLVYSFPEKNIKTVIGFIQPTEKEFIFQYHTRVSQLQAESRFVRADQTGFRKTLWLFILDFLADHSGSHFNRKMFVKATLHTIANRFNVRFEELLFFFSEALKDIPEHLKKTENLLSLVEEIALEEAEASYINAATPFQSNNAVKNNQDKQTWKNTEVLFFFLLHGFFPAGFPDADANWIGKELTLTIQQHSSYTRLFFFEHGTSLLVRKRLLTYLSEKSLGSLVHLSQSGGSDTIAAYVSFILHVWKKTRFVNMEESVFQQSVWDLILLDMFSYRNTIFDAKTFLRDHLQALAKQYNIDLLRLQAILVQESVQQDNGLNLQINLSFLLAEILSETKTSKPEHSGEASTKKPTRKTKDRQQELYAEKELSLEEILSTSTTLIKNLHKSFVLSVLLHLLEFGKLPVWAMPGTISVGVFIARMRVSFPNELRTGLVYAAKTGKVNSYLLYNYTSLFITDFAFLFETILPKKIMLFFKELQSVHIMPDVFFANAFVSALAETADGTPDLQVFFSSLLQEIEQTHGKEPIKNIVFHSVKLASLKENNILQRAFNKAIKSVAYEIIPSGIRYSHANLTQVIAISTQHTNAFAEYKEPEELLKWINHYASHKQLPSSIKPPEGFSEKRLVAWILEFLFTIHKHALQELLSNIENLSAVLLIFSELLQDEGQSLRVRYFLETESRKQLLVHNDTLPKLNEQNPSSWRSFVQKMIKLSPDNRAHKTFIQLMKQESSRTFITQYINDEELKQLFEKNHRIDLWNWYLHFQDASSVLAFDHFERQQFRKHMIGFFLVLFLRPEHKPWEAKELSFQFVELVLTKTGGTIETVQEKILSWKAEKSGTLSSNAIELLKQLSLSIHKTLQRTKYTTIIEQEIRSIEKNLYYKLKNDGEEQIQKELSQQKEDAKDSQKNKVLAYGEQIYIQNAGMVLLHPFLATLFVRAELTKEGVFTVEEAQAKAVQLLQYAITGEEQNPEYELVLNKLLSGLQPNDVLVHYAALETASKELITGMLHAIMMQWDKMKNTSLDGFRNAFLKREGYLFQTEENWVLRVEQRGYDVILQTLPWSFGMIKFSWMNKPLVVEWN